jgi:hypothetical protein
MELVAGFIAVAAMVVFFICVGVTSGKNEAKSFEKRFPPISDAEFVARCTPGTDPEIALRVRWIVADRLGVEYERIYPSTRFVEDIGAD